MLRACLLIWFALSTLTGFGQHVHIRALVEKGDRAVAKGNFDEAVRYYKAAEKLNPEDAKVQFNLGVSLLNTNWKYEALPHLQKAYQLKKNISEEIDFYLGSAYQECYQFTQALAHFRLFKKKFKKLSAITDHKIGQCLLGDSLVSRPKKVLIQALEYPINSIYYDFAPLIDSAGTTLVFTSARDSSQRDTRNNNRLFESVLVSDKIGGAWTEPVSLGREVNHEAHDAATFISADGTSLVLYYGDSRDLYLSKLTMGRGRSDYGEGIWGKAEPFPAPINSVSWESSGCFSPDGQFFFFSSDRSGGYGELDIYMCKLGSDGKWGNAINLGPEINTPANEDSPFMHTDGTLYFGSDGLPGLGNYDIFKTKFKNGKWHKPENLGYPINTPEYDNYFFLSADEKHGYFTSVRKEGLGNTDIFMATFSEQSKIDPVTLAIKLRADSIAKADSLISVARIVLPDSVLAKNASKADSILKTHTELQPVIKREFGVATEFRGKVIDEVDGKPLHAQIMLVDNKSNKTISKAFTNPKNGVFIIIIPHGGNYGLSANCDGYLFNSMNFDVPAFAESQTIETAIMMARAEVGSKSTLKNIFFDSGKSALKAESKNELDQLVNLLTRNPRLRVQINGHTDSNGDNAMNKVLSFKRSEAVVNYLISKGIDANRLKAVGYGEERPLVSNDDEEGGREINRRTEIEVVEVTQP